MRQKPEGSTKGSGKWNIFGKKKGGTSSKNGEQRDGGQSKSSNTRDHYFNFREAKSMATKILKIAQVQDEIASFITCPLLRLIPFLTHLKPLPIQPAELVAGPRCARSGH